MIDATGQSAKNWILFLHWNEFSANIRVTPEYFCWKLKKGWLLQEITYFQNKTLWPWALFERFTPSVGADLNQLTWSGVPQAGRRNQTLLRDVLTHTGWFFVRQQQEKGKCQSSKLEICILKCEALCQTSIRLRMLFFFLQPWFNKRRVSEDKLSEPSNSINTHTEDIQQFVPITGIKRSLERCPKKPQCDS